MNYHSYMKIDSQTNGNEGRAPRRRARTRADLIQAARHVFALRGYHEASIAEITAHADVGVGTFYLHFRDKDELFTILLDEGFREMRAQIAETLAQPSQTRTLEALIRTIFLYAYAQRDLFQIALSGKKGGPTQIYSPQVELIRCLNLALEGFADEPFLAGYNLSLLARLITGIVTQAIIWWFEYDEPEPMEMAEQVLSVLRHGLPEQLFTKQAEL